MVELWSLPRSLVVPQRDRARPSFWNAVARSGAAGWPIYTRRSGGLAVPHGAGTLCIELSWCDSVLPTSRQAFAKLAQLLMRAIREMGCVATIGEVANAMCPGAWDLAVDGCKVAGLSQHRPAPSITGAGRAYVHAILFCGCDLVAGIEALNAYYASLDDPRRFCTSVHRNLGKLADLQRLTAILTQEAAHAGFVVRNRNGVMLPPAGGIERAEQARLAF